MTSGLVFDDALADLRISGCVLLHETYAPPWAIDIPDQRVLHGAVNATEGTRVVPFHLVRRGEFQLHANGGDGLEVQSRDVVICPGGESHRMRQGMAATAIPLAKILGGERPPPPPPDDPEVTELICGVFLLRAAPLNPLLAALPSVLKVTTADHASNALLAGTAELLAVEVQRAEALSGSYTAARLLEIFCAEILRAYRNDANLGGAGWFRGLADPKLGRALALIHADPATPWSVAKLAAAVALSPSRFASRFRATIGEPAMAYVTRWRMVRACRLLEECEETIDAVARRTGYTTASSFSRAFKASVGKSPAAWRQSRLR